MCKAKIVSLLGGSLVSRVRRLSLQRGCNIDSVYRWFVVEILKQTKKDIYIYIYNILVWNFLVFPPPLLCGSAVCQRGGVYRSALVVFLCQCNHGREPS